MKKTIFLTLGVLLTAPAYALDLLQTYQLAMANDATFSSYKNTYLAERQNIDLAKAQLKPNVSLSASLTRGHFEPKNFPDSVSYTSKQTTLSLRQPIFRAELWARYQQAKIASSLSEAVLQGQQQELMLNVSQAYFDVLRADATLEALKSEETALERQSNMMDARFKSGVIAKTDVTEAFAQYQNAKAERIAGEVNTIAAREALSALLGQPVEKLAVLREDMAYQSPYPAQIEAWVGLAQQRNAQVEVNRYQYQIANKNKDIQAATGKPTLDFVGQRNINRQGLSTQSFADGDTTSFGLELSVPLYNGGQTRILNRQAHYQAEAAHDLLRAAQRQATAQARAAFLNLQVDANRLEARAEAVKSSELVAKSSQAGYQLGVRNVVDVLLAQRNAFAARRDYVNARYDYVVNVVKLHAAAGQLSASTLAELNALLAQ